MQDADYQLYTDSVNKELVLSKMVTDELRARANKVLDLLGLNKLKGRHPASLSGGEKQRLSLACAYCADVDVVVLDEPTSGLDYMNIIRVAKYIQLLCEEGKMVIIITHDNILIGAIQDKQ